MHLRQTIARSRALHGLREDMHLLRTRSARRIAAQRQQAETLAKHTAVERQITDYLAGPGLRRLQIGSGRTVLPGWLSTDLDPQKPGVLRLDATRAFPFPDDSFDVVFTEHMIEHVSWVQGQSMLAECRRVLKPGGVLRVATPDLAVLVALYRGEAGADGDHYVEWVTRRYLPRITHQHPVFVLNNAVRNWGHTFLYDGETLELALSDAGFVDAGRQEFGQSAHEALRGVESHGSAVANERSVLFETMVFEATKPG